MTRVRRTLGVAGIILALAGIGLESRGLVWIAMGLLAASILLRVVISIQARRAHDSRERGQPPPEDR